MINKFEVQGIVLNKKHYPSVPLEKDGEPVIGKDGNVVMKKEFYMIKVATIGDTLAFFVDPDKAELAEPNNTYMFSGYLTSRGTSLNQIKPIKESK